MVVKGWSAIGYEIIHVILTIRQQTWVPNTMCWVVVLLSSKAPLGTLGNKKKGKSTDVFSYKRAFGSACILCYLKQVFQEVLCEFVEDLPASLR